jgi:AcrR family transcriptional regulator
MNNSNLIEWLSDSRSADYFTKSFEIRAAVLVFLLIGQGGSLAEIGRRYGVSRQSIHRHFKKAQEVYGQPSTGG